MVVYIVYTCSKVLQAVPSYNSNFLMGWWYIFVIEAVWVGHTVDNIIQWNLA